MGGDAIIDNIVPDDNIFALSKYALIFEQILDYLEGIPGVEVQGTGVEVQGTGVEDSWRSVFSNEKYGKRDCSSTIVLSSFLSSTRWIVFFSSHVKVRHR